MKKISIYLFGGVLVASCSLYLFPSLKSWFKKTETAVTQVADVAKTTAETVAGKASEVTKSAAGKAEDLAIAPIKKLIWHDQPAVKNNPYAAMQAHVRIGNELCDAEKTFLAQRKPRVKTALEKLLGVSLDEQEVPTIALIGSGGGIRAKTLFTGAIAAAQETGLFDTATYLVGLSGSTWAMGEWLASGKSVAQFKGACLSTMGNGVFDNLTNDELVLMVNALLVKWSFDEPISMVDLWGLVVGNRFFSPFGNNRQRVYLSEQQNLLKDSAYPLPIYTAISGEKDMPGGWYEFTPYEIGSWKLGCYVPTWAFGRKFDNGVSQNFAPEQPLSILLGVCGSAFAATVKVMYDDKFKNIKVGHMQPAIDLIMKKLGDERVTTGEFNNYTYHLAQSPLRDADELNLVDAGLDFNLPYPPVSGDRAARKADILIFVDASKTMKGAPALAGAEQYAREHKLLFPVIDYTDIEKRGVSIFSDPKNPACPLVIYLARIKDAALWQATKDDPAFASYVSLLDTFDPEKCLTSGYCKTENFEYSKENTEQLMALSEWNLKANMPKITQAIKSYLENRRGK